MTDRASTGGTAYDTIASVCEFLMPDELLEPEGAVAAFAPVVDRLAPGARLLDRAADTGRTCAPAAERYRVTAPRPASIGARLRDLPVPDGSADDRRLDLDVPIRPRSTGREQRHGLTAG